MLFAIESKHFSQDITFMHYEQIHKGIYNYKQTLNTIVYPLFD
jgi:hypothetical protein